MSDNREEKERNHVDKTRETNRKRQVIRQEKLISVDFDFCM